MTIHNAHNLIKTFVLVVVNMAGMAQVQHFVLAQEPSPRTSSSDSAPAPTTSKWDKIEQPNTNSPEELKRFIEEVSKRQPATREQYVEMQSAIKAAAEVALKHQSDRKGELGVFLENAFVSSSVMLMGNNGKDAQLETMKKFIDYLKALKAPQPNDLKMALLAVQNLEQLDDRSLAKNSYQEIVHLLESKKKDDLAPWIEVFRGNLQRLESFGKVIELKSKTVDGQNFDLASTRGKYVLLYFWATWDKVTNIEYQYLAKLYSAYHDAGFEVVAVSFDTDRVALEKFLAERSVPWTTIWEAEDQWAPRMIQRYGISAIPASILLDKEGKVINLEARGLVLGKLLRDAFPDVKVADEQTKPTAQNK